MCEDAGAYASDNEAVLNVIDGAKERKKMRGDKWIQLLQQLGCNPEHEEDLMRTPAGLKIEIHLEHGVILKIDHNGYANYHSADSTTKLSLIKDFIVEETLYYHNNAKKFTYHLCDDIEHIKVDKAAPPSK